jgi:hypothetical protein
MARTGQVVVAEFAHAHGLVVPERAHALAQRTARVCERDGGTRISLMLRDRSTRHTRHTRVIE